MDQFSKEFKMIHIKQKAPGHCQSVYVEIYKAS